MNVSIAVYEVRGGQEITWWTVGLGPHDTQRSGRSDVRVQTVLTEALDAVLRGLDPSEQWWFEFPVGVTLERVRMELVLRDGAKRRAASGLFPVVLSPHWVSVDEQRTRLFHPMRPKAWAWLHPEQPLADQARALFTASWGALDDEEIEALATNGKDALRRVAFTAHPKTILDDLEDKPGIWDDLDVEPLRTKKRKKKKRGLLILPSLSTDLTLRALDRGVDLGVRRMPYAARMEMLLTGPRKRSTAVIGPPGVGKTTIIRRAIHEMAMADGYAAHRNLDAIHHVYQLSGRRIIAGMSYLGDWEERCVGIIEDARANRVVLFIDDLTDFARLGRTRDSERNLAELFRGPTVRGEIVLLAEATPERWQRLEAEAPAFAAAFAKTVVTPTDDAETLSLLFREARTLERRDGVAIEPRAFKTILDLGSSLFPGSTLPGSALELLAEVVRAEGDPALRKVHAFLVAGQKIAAIKAYRQAHGTGLAESKAAIDAMTEEGVMVARGRPRLARKIDGSDVLALASQKTGLPAELLQIDRALDPEDVARTFRRYVIGQEAGVAAARDLFLRIRSGLTQKGRPYAVYLLTGPTGTGKTELAKAIAEGLYGDRQRLVRFDMSELSGPDAAARLIGDAFDPDGLLTSRVREEPFSVLLFDEIEKAHPAVLQLMLQLFDEGRLTDAKGDTADFTHTVILMTSNLGAERSGLLGFARDPRAVVDAMLDAVRDHFPPELFNRIDRIVPFEPLTKEAAMQIARKELRQLLGRRGLVDRRVWATPTRSVVTKVVDEAFTPRDGARPVKRYLEDQVASALTETLSRGGRASMRLLRVYVHDDEIALHSEALTEAEPTPGRFALSPFVDATREEVVEALREASVFLRSDDDGSDDRSTRGAIEAAIGERMREGRTKAVYELELARQALELLRDRVDDALAQAPRPGPLNVRRGVGSRPKSRGRARLHARRTPLVKSEALALLAETRFLSRVLASGAPSADRHAVFIELLRVGEGTSSARPLVETQGLVPWLLRAYRDARGECDDVAARRRGEPLIELPADANRALDVLPSERPDHVVVKIVGLHVVDFFAGETGSHVWDSVGAGTEVIRVRAFAADDRMTCREILEDHVARRRVFDAALEAGEDPLPDNPEALLTVIRAIRFDPPRNESRVAPLTIEDYGLADARRAELASPVPLLSELLRVRMTRIDEGRDG